MTSSLFPTETTGISGRSGRGITERFSSVTAIGVISPGPQRYSPCNVFRQCRAIFFGERDYFEKIDETGNSTVWVVPSAQSNQMEPVVVTIQPHTALPTDDPHNGEE